MIARAERPGTEEELRDALAAAREPDGEGARDPDGEGARGVVLSGSSGSGAEARADSGPDPVLVSTERMDAILELRPRDFTVTVEPGLRVARLRETVEERGLWLAAGGPGAERSVGGWIAAASAGPWDAASGPVRRQLLACRVSTHDGRLLEWGRPVMKNVAGYDIPRLMAGSRGRLGALTRVTLRLWPRPGAIETHEARGEPERLEALVAVLEAACADALTWVWDAASGHRLRAVLAGSTSSVSRRRGELARRAGAVGLALTQVSAAGPADDPADRGRRAGAIAFRWTPGRGYVARGLRMLSEGAGTRPARLVAWPATGTILAEFEGVSDAIPALPGGVGPAVGVDPGGRNGRRAAGAGGPGAPSVGIERGGPAAHAEAERRRAPEVLEIERRVLSALGGRPRAWQADYV